MELSAITKYPFTLTFNIDDDGTFVFPVQSEIENIAIYTGQDNNLVYFPEGIKFGNNTLVWNDHKKCWVFE